MFFLKSIEAYMWELFAHKVVRFITWAKKIKLEFFLKNLDNFFFFDVILVVNHIIYYRKGDGGSFPSLGCGVSCEFGSYVTMLMHHFGSNLHKLSFLNLCKLIWLWTSTYEFNLILSQNTHPCFYIENLGSHLKFAFY
jgi:hypothetical protein